MNQILLPVSFSSNYHIELQISSDLAVRFRVALICYVSHDINQLLAYHLEDRQ